MDFDKFFKSATDSWNAAGKKRGERFVMCFGELMPYSEALGCVGVNKSLREFIKMAREATSDEVGALHGANTVLHGLTAHSAIKNAVWLVRNAQELGINLNIQDKYRQGVTDRSKARQAWLKQMGMDDQEDRFDWMRGRYLKNTPLMLAVKKGWNHRSDDAHPSSPTMGALILALLQSGADPNIQDGCGNTAMHIAMLQRDWRVVNALLKHGARLDIKNNGGRVPEDLLNVKYEDINPFLYFQTGGDVNCYIHTLAPKRNWESDLRWVVEAVEKHKLGKPALLQVNLRR